MVWSTARLACLFAAAAVQYCVLFAPTIAYTARHPQPVRPFVIYCNDKVVY